MTPTFYALVLSLAALSTALPLHDRSRCLVGPSFWCQSKETMALCHAEEHCLKAAEKVAPVVEKVAPVVEKVAPVVEKVAPVAEKVAPVVEKVAPMEEKAAPPVEVKETSLPHAKIVESEKSVSIIMDDEMTSTSSSSSSSVISTDPCALCEEIANATIVVAESPEGKAAAKMIMIEACRNLPGSLEQRVCELLVNPIVDAIYDAIEAHVNVTAQSICTSLKLCGSEVEAAKKALGERLSIFKDDALVASVISGRAASTPSSKPSPLSVDPCELCLEISNATLEIADSPGGRAAAKVILAEACKDLPNAIEQRICGLLVGPIVNAIYDQIEAHVHVTAQEICSDLRLCSSKVETAKKPVENRLSASVISHAAVSKPSPVSVDPCALCLEISNITLEIADSPAGRAAANVVVREACKALPNPIEQIICDLFAGPVVNAIYDAIEAHVHVTAQEICSDLRLCSSRSSSNKNNNNNNNNNNNASPLMSRLKTVIEEQKKSEPIKPKANSLECQVCQITMKYLKQYATEDNKKTLIVYFNGTICDKMDPSIRKNCSADVVKIVDELFNIGETQTPLQICQTINACDASVEGVVKVDGKVAELVSLLTSSSSSSSSSPMQCRLCETAASVAKSFATPENEQAALSFLDGALCGKLPTPDRANCTKMLQMTIGNAFAMLNGMTPQRFCEQIGVCGGGSGVVNGVSLDHEAVDGVLRMSAKPSLTNELECELYRYASQTLSPYFTPANAESIVEYLNSTICQKYVAPDQRPTCSLLVKNATDEIFKLVANGQICAKLGVCPEKKSLPWEAIVEVVDAAKIQPNAKKIAEDDKEGYNVVINNINNNIMNVNNNVVGNTIVVNDHVKANVPAPPPSPPHPPKADAAVAAAAAAPSVKNPMECGVCEYVGLALLLGQSPEEACRAAFTSQPATKVDACLGFAEPFVKAMKLGAVAHHSGVLKLCLEHKYC